MSIPVFKNPTCEYTSEYISTSLSLVRYYHCETLPLLNYVIVRFCGTGMTQDQLFQAWKQEAEAALSLRNKGILALFKVVGQREVRS